MELRSAVLRIEKAIDKPGLVTSDGGRPPHGNALTLTEKCWIISVRYIDGRTYTGPHEPAMDN